MIVTLIVSALLEARGLPSHLFGALGPRRFPYYVYNVHVDCFSAA